jgi:acyl-CoA synthetase (AMP-forming)/AMP-acid ligase II
VTAPGAALVAATGVNLGRIQAAVAAAVPDRDCLVQGDRRLAYGEVADRATRLANLLRAAGLGCHTERHALRGHESGQDMVGLYLHNGPEFVEAMLGAYRARVAPFNVNYRYGVDELAYLLRDAGAAGLVFHATFAPQVEALRERVPGLRLLLQVADGSGNPLAAGALAYEDALAAASPALPGPPAVEPSPDDLFVLYTGGTTGMPKGVLWRQDDIFAGAMGGDGFGAWGPAATEAEVVGRVQSVPGVFRTLVVAPLMHGGAQLQAFGALGVGGTVVFPPVRHTTATLDPAAVWRTVEREAPHALTVIGDAMARPLVDELERGGYDAGSLMHVGNGGATLSAGLKRRLLAALPQVAIGDAVGSSEAGYQLGNTSSGGAGGAIETNRFEARPTAAVVSADRTRVLAPGADADEDGWLAQSGRIALGYLGDPDKTARTFPVVDGTRYAVPGDRARLLPDGRVELLGRDAVTINTGGEKVYAEEVEQALIDHPAVRDVIVVGRPSERWGQEVCAVVALADGAEVGPDELSAHAGTCIARYKLPKAYVVLPALERSPSGKADYRWAADVARAAP